MGLVLILASVFLVLRRQLAQQLLQFLLWCHLLAFVVKVSLRDACFLAFIAERSINLVFDKGILGEDAGRILLFSRREEGHQRPLSCACFWLLVLLDRFDYNVLLLLQLLDLLEQQPLVQGSLVLLFEQDLLDDLQVLGLGDDVLEVRLPSLLLLRPRLGLPQARGEGLSLLDEAIIVSIFEVHHLSTVIGTAEV